MKKNQTNAVSIETLEGRQMFSATPAVVGYLPDYNISKVQSAGSSTLNKINWNALTQINYFSVLPDASTGYLPGANPNIPADVQAIGNSSGGYSLSQLAELVTEAHQHNVKVEVVVGGAGLDSGLTSIIANPTLQTNFAQSVQFFCNKFGVDGVDLDWEVQHPTMDQINNYGDLIHTLRANTSGLTLSAAVYPEQLSIATAADPTGSDWSTFAYDLNTQAMSDLDQIGVMDYDLDFAANAPIARAEADMDAWATTLGNNGLSSGKLLFGVPFYGMAGNSWGDAQDASYASLLGNNPTIATGQNVINTSVAGDFNGASMNWTFDSVATVQAKTQYAIDHNFGGVMAWDIGQDHLAGDTNGQNDPYSLLAAIGRTVAGNAATTGTTPAASNTGVIAGSVFGDANSNQTQDSNEAGLAGWTVYIDTNKDGVQDAGDVVTTTDANGNFQFSNVAVGNYNVAVVAKAGFNATNATDQLAVVNNAATSYVGFGESAIAPATTGGHHHHG